MEGAIAAAICDNSLENWATDGETSDSTSEDIDFGRTQFGTCVQCNSQNQNPHYRYCEKCYQVRYWLINYLWFALVKFFKQFSFI